MLVFHSMTNRITSYRRAVSSALFLRLPLLQVWDRSKLCPQHDGLMFMPLIHLYPLRIMELNIIMESMDKIAAAMIQCSKISLPMNERMNKIAARTNHVTKMHDNLNTGQRFTPPP